MPTSDEILTAAEVAAELRCSKAQVYAAINGKVAGIAPLPAIALGRRKLVRRSALERWKRASERNSISDMLPPSPEVNAAGRIEEESRA